jgi:asparagine synthase (glutamine-hydrolysing)
VTEVYAAAPDDEEAACQEQVVRHLGLSEWVRIDAIDGDLLAEPSTASLRRYGLLWPPLAHAQASLFAAAAGGTLITGQGGDEVLGPRRMSHVRHALARPSVRGVRRAALALAPRRARAAVARRRSEHAALLPWLTPDALAEATRRTVEDDVGEPLGWAASLRWHVRRRFMKETSASLRMLAREQGAALLEPFLEDVFVDALARSEGAWAAPAREELMRRLAAGVLPEAVLTRRSKAVFDHAYFAAASRAFVSRWSGAGIDPDLVDEGRLRQEWAKPSPSALSFLLLQQAWLAEAAP